MSEDLIKLIQNLHCSYDEDDNDDNDKKCESNDNDSDKKCESNVAINALLELVKHKKFKRIATTEVNDYNRLTTIKMLANYTYQSLSNDDLREFILFFHHETKLILTETLKQSCFMHLSANVHTSNLFIIQSAMHRYFPLLSSEGVLALSKQPVFYITEGTSVYKDIDRLGWESLVGKHCFRIIPLIKDIEENERGDETMADNEQQHVYCMDTDSLEASIIRDKESGYLPCAVFCVTGGDLHHSLPYQYDNLDDIRDICNQHGLWLHAEGTSVLINAIDEPKSPCGEIFIHSDSVVTQPYLWLGYDDPTCVTFLRRRPQYDILLSSSNTQSISKESYILLFSLWFVLASKPLQYISTLAQQCMNSCIHLEHSLLSQAFPVQLTPREGTMGSHPHLLFFQVIEDDENDIITQLSMNHNEFNWRLHEYIKQRCIEDKKDNKNDNDTMQEFLSTCISQISYYGRYGFLFHPFSSNSALGTLNKYANTDNIDIFVTYIQEFINAVTRTLSLRLLFHTEIVANYSHIFTFIPLSSIQGTTNIGLGCIQYTPTFSYALYDEQLSILNESVTKILHQNYPFIQIIKQNKHIYIGFDVITDIKLLNNIKNNEQKWMKQFIQHISILCEKAPLPKDIQDAWDSLVVEGIQQAHDKLTEENYNNGAYLDIARSVPILSNVLDWIVPIDAAVGPKVSHNFDIRSRNFRVRPLERKIE